MLFLFHNTMFELKINDWSCPHISYLGKTLCTIILINHCTNRVSTPPQLGLRPQPLHPFLLLSLSLILNVQKTSCCFHKYFSLFKPIKQLVMEISWHCTVVNDCVQLYKECARCQDQVKTNFWLFIRVGTFIQLWGWKVLHNLASQSVTLSRFILGVSIQNTCF